LLLVCLILGAGLPVAALAVYAYRRWDQPLARWGFAVFKKPRPRWLSFLNELGVGAWWLLSSAALVGLGYGLPTWKSVGAWAGLLFMSIILGGGVCLVLKCLCGRLRPKYLLEPEPGLPSYGFHPGLLNGRERLGSSFPSGHAATALAWGWVLGLSWPPLLALTLPVALLVAWTRALRYKHYASDIITGAYLGSAAALLLHAWLRQAGWL
jgi:membrane-associated phospholipid phosphatase